MQWLHSIRKVLHRKWVKLIASDQSDNEMPAFKQNIYDKVFSRNQLKASGLLLPQKGSSYTFESLNTFLSRSLFKILKFCQIRG